MGCEVIGEPFKHTEKLSGELVKRRATRALHEAPTGAFPVHRGNPRDRRALECCAPLTRRRAVLCELIGEPIKHSAKLIGVPVKSTGKTDTWHYTSAALAGDMICVEDTDYVVQSLVVQFKLVRGRYQREHHRLDCMSASRYLLNRNLENCLSKKGGKPSKSGDGSGSAQLEGGGEAHPSDRRDSAEPEEDS